MDSLPNILLTKTEFPQTRRRGSGGVPPENLRNSSGPSVHVTPQKSDPSESLNSSVEARRSPSIAPQKLVGAPPEPHRNPSEPLNSPAETRRRVRRNSLEPLSSPAYTRQGGTFGYRMSIGICCYFSSTICSVRVKYPIEYDIAFQFKENTQN